MKALFLSLLALTLTVSCSTPRKSGTKMTRIVHGTSFGHCMGYCMMEEIYEGDAILFRRMSRQEDRYPEKNEKAVLSSKEFEALAESIDYAKFMALPETIGCPDCADGGAEYVEITTGNETKRVTFEAGSSPEGLEEALIIIRKNKEGRFAEE